MRRRELEIKCLWRLVQRGEVTLYNSRTWAIFSGL